MLIDNRNKCLYDFLNERIIEKSSNGKFYFVSGFFSLRGLSFLADLSSKLEEINCILGEVNEEDGFETLRFIDLINDSLSIENLDKVIIEKEKIKALLNNQNFKIKTLEPNFCHAKLYLFENTNDDALCFYVTGSANLTSAGLGLKETSNVEMSIAKTGKESEYNELKQWFKELWNSPKAHNDKIIYIEKEKKKISYKDFILQLVDQILKPYSPEDIYYKILIELFEDQLIEDEQQKEKIKRLEETIIYKSLYEFQKIAVRSLIYKIEKLNGAILADAVGLGKTWTALAIAKYYQMQGREIIIICPKRLMSYWKQFHKNFESKFKNDELEFFVRSHSDLEDLERLERYDDRSDKLFKNDKPKLFIIDESHNFRNDKTSKFENLITILNHNPDCKVLLLTATPINNSFKDLRNQIYIISKKNDNAFKNILPDFNIYYNFINAQKKLEEYIENKITLKEFINKLDKDFKKFMDSVLVARNRKFLSLIEKDFSFPEKKIFNINVEVPIMENEFKKFIELNDSKELAENLRNLFSSFTAYRPSFFMILPKDISVLDDPRIRESALTGIMVTLLIKRIESSWYAFYLTVKRIYEYFKEVHQKVETFINENNIKDNVLNKKEEKIDLISIIENIRQKEEEEDETLFDEFYIGKSNQISLKDIAESGNIEAFKKSLEVDIDILERLVQKIENYKLTLEQRQTEDKKLKELKKILHDIQHKNEKVIIFTSYHDTAEYLFNELKKEFDSIAIITGNIQKDKSEYTFNQQEILERFTPFTKLFLEKEQQFPMDKNKTQWENYLEWKEWIKKNNKKEIIKKLENPINILIATDVLSEGQNLQEARHIINYDIHWNPVRLIQRIGRIDRVGSPYKEIYIYNFWAADSIEDYLKLKQKITNKFLMMILTKTEIEAITEEVQQKLKEVDIILEEERKLYEQFKEQILKQDFEWDSGENKLGFDDFSYDLFREQLRKKYEQYKKIRNGIFSGLKNPSIDMLNNKNFNKGIVALLGVKKPSNTKKIDYIEKILIFIDESGKEIVPVNRENLDYPQLEILEFLKQNKDYPTYLPVFIDGDIKKTKTFLENLKKALSFWSLNKFDFNKEKINPNQLEILNLASENRTSKLSNQKPYKFEELYNLNNIDLICWMYVENS